MQEKKDSNELNFYHSKESFSENASPEVKWMRSIQVKRPSVLGSIFSNKATAFLFITILVISGIYSAFMFFGPEGIQIDGSEFTATAFEFDSTMYVALKKNQIKPLNAPVNIQVVVATNNLELGSFYHLLTSEKEQIFRYTFPYTNTIQEIQFTITVNDKKYLLKTKLSKEKN